MSIVVNFDDENMKMGPCSRGDYINIRIEYDEESLYITKIIYCINDDKNMLEKINYEIEQSYITTFQNNIREVENCGSISKLHYHLASCEDVSDQYSSYKMDFEKHEYLLIGVACYLIMIHLIECGILKKYFGFNILIPSFHKSDLLTKTAFKFYDIILSVA